MRHVNRTVRALVAAGAIATAVAASTAASSAGASAASRPQYPYGIGAPAAVRSGAGNLMTDVFTALSSRTRPDDPYYWDGQTLTTGQTACFRCEAGPALFAATTWRVTGSKQAADMAKRTFNNLIRTHHAKDGSFGPPMGNEAGPGIQTSLFANEIGQAYLMLEPVLTESDRVSWSRAVVGAADWIIASQKTPWYANGNIVLAQAQTLLLASVLNPTRRGYFEAQYASAMRFAIAPSQARWKGFGFIYTSKPQKPDGADGRGYFAESGGGAAPGLDVDYLQMQSNVLGWMYWVRPTNENLRLLNMTVNELMNYVDKSRWWLQTGSGTRHTQAIRWVGLETSSMPMAATRGGRADLRYDLQGYLSFMRNEWLSATTYANPGAAFAFGSAAALAMFSMARVD